MEVASAGGRESIQAWRPPVPGIREVLHATHVDHAYPPHTHDAWTVFIVDRGEIRYDLDRQPHGAGPSMVSVLPPHVVHDGRAASEAGYRKRVLYLETSVLGEELIGAAVDRPFLVGSFLRGRVSALHDTLRCRDDALEAETRLAFLAERIGASLGAAVARETEARQADAAEQLRAYLDANCFEAVTLGSVARLVGIGETQLAKAFSATFGIAPHAYLTGRRLDAARRRILDGQPLADVAAEVGFCDQAHFTRRFQRFLGTTPGRFRTAIGDPD